MTRTAINLALLYAAFGISGSLQAQGPLAPSTDPSPGMKRLDQIHSGIPLQTGPIIISQPGHYYLTQNVTMGSGTPAISITSSNVTLDLNGFTVKTTAVTLNQASINISAAVPVHNVTVTNGTVRGGHYGVALQNARGCSVSSLSITSTRDFAVYLNSVSGSKTLGNKIDRCVIYGCRSGIHLGAEAGGVCKGNALTSCVIDGDSTISGIACMGNGSNAICSGNLIEDCLIGSAATGLRFVSLDSGQCVGNKAVRCSITDGGTGVRFQAIAGAVEGNELKKSTVADTSVGGIILSSGGGSVRGNRIEDCVITGTEGYGVFFKGTEGRCAGNALLKSIVHDTPTNNIYLQDAESNRIQDIHSTTGSRGIVLETTSYNIVTGMTVAECPQPYLNSAGTNDTKGPLANATGTLGNTGAAASPWANFYRE